MILIPMVILRWIKDADSSEWIRTTKCPMASEKQFCRLAWVYWYAWYKSKPWIRKFALRRLRRVFDRWSVPLNDHDENENQAQNVRSGHGDDSFPTVGHKIEVLLSLLILLIGIVKKLTLTSYKNRDPATSTLSFRKRCHLFELLWFFCDSSKSTSEN